VGRLAACFGAGLLLAPAMAWAQDATVLAVAFGPPLLAAPIVAQYVRKHWLLPSNGTAATLRVLVVGGIVECLLWVAVGYCVALVVFQEQWLALVAAMAGIAAIALVMRTLGAPHRSWGFTLAMLCVFPAVFAVGVLIAVVVGFSLA
jgi:hypothetical protein